METQRLRRRRSRRRARKKQIAFLILVAIGVAVFVWSRILVERRKDASLFAAEQERREASAASGRMAAALAASATKNLILFVGNGYGIAPMTAARIYAAGEEGALAVDAFPETALVRTYSRNASAADSAAAMSAYMTGVKVDNEVLSQTADTRAYGDDGRPSAAHDETTCPIAGNGTAVPTLLELAKGAGRSVGVVTTARVTQAVAAASYAHLCQRDGENTLAAQLVPGGPDANARLKEGVDVVFGGGWEHFLPKGDPRGSSRNDSRDLFAELRAKGYAVIVRQSELVATGQPPVARMIGLFNRAQMSYEVDRLGTNEPSLADMTTRAIDLLQRNAGGYLLVVEGGRIGEAIDGSTLRRALGDAQAFDQAIAAALAKVRELDPDLRNTTLVVTADHDQTLVMNGDSVLTGRSVEARPGVLGIVHGVDDPAQFAPDRSGRPYTILATATGTHRVKGSRAQAPAASDLGVADRGYRYESAVATTMGIGGGDVMLSAIGANAARFHGTIDNTQVFALLRGAMGL